MEYISFSQINTIMTCPKSYEYKYIDKIPSRESGALIQGRIIHKTIEIYLTHKKDNELKNSKYYHSIIKNEFWTFVEGLARTDALETVAWNDIKVTPKIARKSAISSDDFYQTVKELNKVEAKELTPKDLNLKELFYYNPKGLILMENAKLYLEIFRLVNESIKLFDAWVVDIGKKINPKYTEKEILIEVEKGFNIKGYVDLITEDGYIFDTKVRSQKPTQNDIDNSLQLSIYAIAYYLETGKLPNGIGYHCLIKNKKPKTETVMTSRTMDDLRWAMGIVLNYIKYIKNRNFPKSPNGWHCSNKYCTYYKQCHKDDLYYFDVIMEDF